jgi:hypothetical protein
MRAISIETVSASQKVRTLVHNELAVDADATEYAEVVMMFVSWKPNKVNAAMHNIGDTPGNNQFQMAISVIRFENVIFPLYKRDKLAPLKFEPKARRY